MYMLQKQTNKQTNQKREKKKNKRKMNDHYTPTQIEHNMFLPNYT